MSELSQTHAHELESKVILSSMVRDWSIAGNFTAAKNLSRQEGFEFGYAHGAYRPRTTLASGTKGRFCRENFEAGIEVYGGLGSTNGFGFHDTAHHVGPGMEYELPSCGFGLSTGSPPKGNQPVRSLPSDLTVEGSRDTFLSLSAILPVSIVIVGVLILIVSALMTAPVTSNIGAII